MTAPTVAHGSRSSGGRLPAWVVLGAVVGGILFLIGVATALVPRAGLSATASDGLAFAGAIVALLVLVLYLLRPAPVGPAPRIAARPVPSMGPTAPTPTARPVRPAVRPAAPSAPPPSRVPTPAAQLSASNAVRRAAAVGSLGAAAAPAAPVPATASQPPESPEPPGPSGRGLSSIPGAYLQALDPQRDPGVDWSEVAPPVAASLPFVAAVQRSPNERPPARAPSDPSRAEVLEIELARLKARVRELEARRPPILSGVSSKRSATSTAAAAPKGPEPPAPPVHVAAVGPRGCAGCGEALTTSQPPPLCWGCGRALCPSCYWRFGPGPGLHRCPECLARSPNSSTGISGGRAARSTGPTASPLIGPTPISPPVTR